MCTKPFSQTKNKGKLFLVAQSSGPLLARMPLKSWKNWTSRSPRHDPTFWNLDVFQHTSNKLLTPFKRSLRTFVSSFEPDLFFSELYFLCGDFQ